MKSFSIVLILFVLTFSSCDEAEKTEAFSSSKVDNAPGSCSYFTRDNNNTIVLSWITQPNDSSFGFCFSRYDAKKKNFSTPVLIPSSTNVFPHSENIPKIIFKPSGEIIAVWGASNPNPKNKYSGLVYYAQSFDSGAIWTDAKRLVNDTSSYDQRYFDVALMPNGEVGIVWLDNRKTINKEGAAIYFASTDGNNGFPAGKIIGQPTCECCRVDLFVDKENNIHVAYRAILNDSIRDIVHSISVDSGRSFSTASVISADNWMINACPHTGPSITETEGNIHVAWYTMGTSAGIFQTSSSDNGRTFKERQAVVGTIGRHPQMTSIRNNPITVWDEIFQENSKMFTRIALKNGIETKSATYLTKANGLASYPVIQPINDETAIVAYTQKDGDDKFVYYTIVNL